MKKILALLLVTALLSTSLVGCGKKEGQKPVSNTSQEKGSDSKSTSDGSDSLYTAPGTFPITNEKIELDFLTLNVPMIEDLETNEFVEYMEDMTNIHINWSLTQKDKKEEKINLVMASGDLPDVFFGLGLTANMEAQYGVDQKLFLPLNDLIEEHGTNLKANIFDKYDYVKGKMTSTDGNIYSLLTWNDCYHCNHALKYWINRPWMEKLNLEMPTTTEEFREVLRAFKEQDPNGNGIADEIPLTGSDTWHGKLVPFLMNAFILDPDDVDKELRTIVRDGKVFTIADKEEYREGLRYIKSLYDEGLISKGSFTQKADQLKQIATNPDAEVVGVIPGGFAGLIIDGTVDRERYGHYDPLPPLEGPTGLKQTTKFESAAQLGQFTISSTSEYADAAMRWVDYLYTTEGQGRRCGAWEEGVDFVKAEPGELGVDGKQAKIRSLKIYTHEQQNRGIAWLGPEYLPAEDRLGGAVDPQYTKYDPEGLEILLYEATNKYYEPYVPTDVKRLPSVRLTADENDEIQIIKTELEKYIKESRLKFLLGDWSLDDDWDQYVDGMKRIGVDHYYEVLQVAYDRQYK